MTAYELIAPILPKQHICPPCYVYSGVPVATQQSLIPEQNAIKNYLCAVAAGHCLIGLSFIHTVQSIHIALYVVFGCPLAYCIPILIPNQYSLFTTIGKV